MENLLKCKRCGEKTESLTSGLCNDCYVEENEGPCGCFNKLERFE